MSNALFFQLISAFWFYSSGTGHQYLNVPPRRKLVAVSHAGVTVPPLKIYCNSFRVCQSPNLPGSSALDGKQIHSYCCFFFLFVFFSLGFREMVGLMIVYTGTHVSTTRPFVVVVATVPLFLFSLYLLLHMSLCLSMCTNQRCNSSREVSCGDYVTPTPQERPRTALKTFGALLEGRRCVVWSASCLLFVGVVHRLRINADGFETVLASRFSNNFKLFAVALFFSFHGWKSMHTSPPRPPLSILVSRLTPPLKTPLDLVPDICTTSEQKTSTANSILISGLLY